MNWQDFWFDWSIDAWPVLMAVLVGASCGLLGSVFLLRQAALLGDAVSHSVLPGIALGLLLSGVLQITEEDSAFGNPATLLFILGGALASGLLCTLTIEALSKLSRIKGDSALAAVFPAFFAAGVIMVEVLASGAHFDANCVFYGSLEVIGSGRQVAPTGIASFAVLIFFLAFHKETLASSFDRGYSKTIGMSVGWIDIALITLLTATIVCAFEAVGAILVIAFLIIPPATAYLLVDRFHRVLILAAIIGVISGIAGCWLTIALGNVGFQTARAPTMAIVAGGIFALVFFLAPGRGVLAQYLDSLALKRRILDENFLGAMYRLARENRPDGDVTKSRLKLELAADSLRYPLQHILPAVRRETRRREIVSHPDGTVSLTAPGTERIERILRAHRLWESYMISELGAAPDHVHDAADEIEHYLQPRLVDDLERYLDKPKLDPHGREIPPRA